MRLFCSQMVAVPEGVVERLSMVLDSRRRRGDKPDEHDEELKRASAYGDGDREIPKRMCIWS